MYPENPFALRVKRPAVNTNAGLETNMRGVFPGYRGNSSLMERAYGQIQPEASSLRQQFNTIRPTNPSVGYEYPVFPIRDRANYLQPASDYPSSNYGGYGDSFPNGVNPDRPVNDSFANPSIEGNPLVQAMFPRTRSGEDMGFFADLLKRAMGQLRPGSLPSSLPSLYALGGDRQSRFGREVFRGGEQDPYRAFFTRLLS